MAHDLSPPVRGLIGNRAPSCSSSVSVAPAKGQALRCANSLFGLLGERDWSRWREKLEFVSMPRGCILQEANRTRTHVWFPSTSVVSLVYGVASGSMSQIAVVGREGLVGIAVVLGGQTHPSRAVVHVGGYGYRMSAADMQEESREVEVLQILLRYSLSLMVQIAQGVVCNRHHALDQQLCRWLLSNFDRTGSAELRMTHEQLGEVLGFRRESVTENALRLQQLGAIAYSRGRIRLLDRTALQSRACECHAVAVREYERLMCGGATAAT